MFEKLIIHLKNIIFFKLIIYCFVIGLLLWLIPIFKDQYDVSLQRKEKVAKSFSEAAVKLYSIIETDNKILDTYREYEEILNSTDQQPCNQRAMIIYKIKDLTQEFNLEPINVKFSQIFNENELVKFNQVRIKNYNVNIKLNAPDFATVLKVIKRIYTIMPENSIVTLSRIENIEFLDPQIIFKLSSQRNPDLIEAEFNVRIRELSNK